MKRLDTSGHIGHMRETNFLDGMLISGHVGQTNTDLGAGASIDGGSSIIRLQ